MVALEVLVAHYVLGVEEAAYLCPNLHCLACLEALVEDQCLKMEVAVSYHG